MAAREHFDDSAWEAGAYPRVGGGWGAARRHSRLVRALRIGLPVIIFLIVGGMVLSLRSLPGSVPDIGLGGMGISGSSLTMESPSLTGYGARGMSYEVEALKALQDLTKPHIVELETISGRVQQADGGWTTLTADSGVYDNENETLRLDRNIEVKAHDGKSGYFSEADVDLATQSMVSDQPVRLEMPSARIRADRMEVFGGGERVLLRGGVEVVIRLDGEPLKESDDAR